MSLVSHVFQRIRRVSLAQVAIATACCGMLFLSCVTGAAFLHYDLAPGQYFRKAFVGADAWLAHGKEQGSEIPGGTEFGISRDEPGKTFDGFTLYTSTQGTSATLIDMRGNVVHEWSRPFHEVWPNPAHVKYPVGANLIHWFRCRLFPNGDLLAIYQSDADTPHGYGLAKLDKSSQLIWAYADNVHHDLDIGDDGRIYTLTHKITENRVEGLPSISPPYLADELVILSPEGKELDTIPLIAALQNSPYSTLLSGIKAGGLRTSPRPPSFSGPSTPGSPKTAARPAQITMPPLFKESGDVLHANAVKVLNKSLAARSRFKEGQVLVTLCYLNAIVVVDVPSRSVVWAAQGVWQAQHDAEFLGNGNILLYDNSGLPGNTRIIEFDPVISSYPWLYANENSVKFAAAHRGMKQNLPNGNVLIVDPDGSRIFEVARDKSLVWACGLASQDTRPVLTGATRHARTELKFLEGVPVRP